MKSTKFHSIVGTIHLQWNFFRNCLHFYSDKWFISQISSAFRLNFDENKLYYSFKYFIVLRAHRSKFNEIWQKMVTKLELGKKFIMDLIEQSVSAYEQRDELCNKLQNLEGKSQNEQNLHLQVCSTEKKVDIFKIKCPFFLFIDGKIGNA